MWNDIDLYHAVRDFTTDPDSFPIAEVKNFIDELVSSSISFGPQFLNFLSNQHANHQHYIPIVDAAVAKQVNATDIVRTNQF